MGQWKSKWLSKWGCPPEFRDYQELCDLYQWKQLDHATNFKALCEILVEVFARVDAKISDMGARVGLDNAVGDEVDQWGMLVDQERVGSTDDLYKKAIKARARAAIGEGAIDDYWAVAQLVEPDVTFRILEVFPACVRMYFGNLTAEQQTILFDLMCDVPGWGICKQFVELPDDLGELFEWSYLESDPGDPRVLFPIDRHWDHTDGDIPPDQKAGYAFLI